MRTDEQEAKQQGEEEALDASSREGTGTPSGVPSLDSEVSGTHGKKAISDCEEEQSDDEVNPRFDIAIIDADMYIYQAGFGCPEGSPESHALHNLKNIIERIFDFTQPEAYTIYLSGSKNFRYELATLKPYKGNRKDRKPEHFLALRQYLQNNWGAEVTDGIEADDACTILHTEYLEKGLEPVTCSGDKDLLQQMGWNFNLDKNRLKYITEFEADKNFYYQMLVGDSTDNIGGVPSIGPKKAAAILKDARDKVGLETCVQQAYKSFCGPNWRDIMIENGRLLYLQRKPGDVWNPMNL